MKKSIILSIIFLSVSFTSLLNAQKGLKIVKGGVKEVGLVLEYEYLLNNRLSLVGGVTSKKRNYSIKRGLPFLATRSHIVLTKSKGIFGAVRFYNKPFKDGANFYFEHSFQAEQIKGIALKINGGSTNNGIMLFGTLVGVDEDKAKRDNEDRQEINKINLIGSINYGCLVRLKYIVVDMSVGVGIKSLKKRTHFYSTVEMKVGYAF